MQITCPKNPEHKKFLATATQLQNWVIDTDGDFIEDLGCATVLEGPDKDNGFTCQICGAEAEVE